MPAEPQYCPFPCRVEETLGQILAEVQDLKAAFPEDEYGTADILGHRRFHDAKIAAAKAEEAFWTSLKFDLAKKGAIAILTTLAGLIVVGAWATIKLKIGGK